jgi:hypothetical protein
VDNKLHCCSSVNLERQKCYGPVSYGILTPPPTHDILTYLPISWLEMGGNTIGGSIYLLTHLKNESNNLKHPVKSLLWIINYISVVQLTSKDKNVMARCHMVFWAPYPLPMVYRPPYPWYFDLPIHGISTPLPRESWPPYPCHFGPLAMVYRPPYLMIDWFTVE